MAEKMIFDEAFLQQLANLNMALSLRLHEGMQGGRRSTAKGSSLEFSDFREYVPGDDFRRIDWPAYGRLDKLFVKVFMEEKEAVFNLFLDQSQSMSYGTPSKGKVSLQIAAALSYMIMGRLDKVNISLLGRAGNSKAVESGYLNPTSSKSRHGNEAELESQNQTYMETKITPSSGKQGFHQLLESLGKVRFEGSQDFAEQLLREPIRSKGVSVILSDFLFPQGMASLEKALAYLSYKKQHIVLVQILCKQEKEPEEMGDFEFIDSETNHSVRLTLNPKTIAAYKQRFKEYETSLEALARKYGAKFVQIDAEETLENIILKEFYKKQIIF